MEELIEDIVARGNNYTAGGFEGGCDLLVEEVGLDLHNGHPMLHLSEKTEKSVPDQAREGTAYRLPTRLFPSPW